ncbi:MAG: exopolysaccharide biosynthesis protein [Maioricimonas sp. JB049]
MAVSSLTGMLDQFVENTDGEKVSVGDLLEALHTRSYGPLLLAPSFVALSPIGGIPGASIITGSLIILIAVQMFVTPHPWLPSWLLSIDFGRDRLERVVKKMRPYVKWFEAGIKPRYEFLVQSPASYVIAAIAILLALSFYPLAIVPWGVTPPALALVLLSLALTARDGLVAAAGYLVAAVSAGLVIDSWLL